MLIKLMFQITLVMGTLITISSNNWLSAWMGLELNLMSFIPLIMDSFNKRSSEASIKYFMIQTFASIFLLFSSMMLIMLNYNNMMCLLCYSSLFIVLSLKLGAAPLHFWFPATIQGLSWFNCLILMTWQKLAPLYLMMSLNSNLMPLFAITSSIIGAIGGFNQTFLRKILAYSSINHLGWMITTTIMGEKMLLMYFLIYSFMSMTMIMMFNKMNMFHISHMISNYKSKSLNSMLVTNLLSLGGIPPFLGFLPKWIIISNMLYSMTLQIMILTMSSLLTLYYYIRISYAMVMKSAEMNPMNELKISKPLLMCTMFSISSLLLISAIM